MLCFKVSLWRMAALCLSWFQLLYPFCACDRKKLFFSLFLVFRGLSLSFGIVYTTIHIINNIRKSFWPYNILLIFTKYIWRKGNSIQIITLECKIKIWITLSAFGYEMFKGISKIFIKILTSVESRRITSHLTNQVMSMLQS